MAMEILFSDDSNGMLSVQFMNEGDKRPFNSMPESFTGKKLETFYLPEKGILVIGLGKKDDFKADYYRRAAAKAAKLASSYKIHGVGFAADSLSENDAIAIVEGMLLGNYSFDKYKSDDGKFFRVRKIALPTYAKKYHESVQAVAKVCTNVHMVRDLVSDNSDVVTPDFLEKTARAIAKKNRLHITVLHEKELKRLGMNLILAVGQASAQSPRIIVLEYHGSESSHEKVMLVGKGICFDTGGLDIKPRDSMLDMRMDMAGAATVLGIMKSAAELGLRKNIVGLLAVTENLIGEKAYRPKDIIRAYSGLTVENFDTDAEGRLVLADTLSYGARKFNPKLIVEFSTLTGSIVGTFGSHVAGMFGTGNAAEYKKKMYDAGMQTYERVWELPLFEEYLDETAGDRSDLRSLGKTRYNGAIFGAAFLTKFVGDRPFIHIDVAGTAMIDEAKDYMPKDGTGFGVRLAIEFLKKV
ncbi:MAG: leucyl aminopeptidase [Candidatus Diapherotrites archaeon]|uniref:Leucyl aminopeptidase n=1 Tax=Candidatus Iainarchaeum sp. TaxID=3101447 RepID=A0A8T3YK89_9ARCH|nr:leucyl aminopeptidase [Candidatus Diapherotrites archaeon]